jgi:hypothetical protein
VQLVLSESIFPLPQPPTKKKKEHFITASQSHHEICGRILLGPNFKLRSRLWDQILNLGLARWPKLPNNQSTFCIYFYYLPNKNLLFCWLMLVPSCKHACIPPHREAKLCAHTRNKGSSDTMGGCIQRYAINTGRGP